MPLHRVTPRYTFFFRSESPFSQWYPSDFRLEGQTFSCAEQYMMHGKATLFGDTTAAEQILHATEPRRHKELGRLVRGFDPSTWLLHREAIVERGSFAKFSQNADLRAQLLATAGTELVEASPTDLVWGVGLAIDDPTIDDPSRWRGMNLLGRILTRVRARLEAEGTVG